MRILRKGLEKEKEIKNNYKVIMCHNCSAELEVEESDWKHSTVDGKTSITCPWCGERIIQDLTSNKERIIHSIMEELDFDKINETMKALDWHWASVDGDENGIPRIHEIQKFALDLLNSAYDKKTSIECGGFYVEYIPEDKEGSEGLKILFNVESVGVFISNDNKIEYI